MHYLKCEHPGCRQELYLAFCDTCDRLVCPEHSVAIEAGRRRCPNCARLTQICAQPAQPKQLDLFSRVRPRSKRSAHDGLVK